MYRTIQCYIKQNSRLTPYCRDICDASAKLYNRANYILRQYATAVDAFSCFKPLHKNQMEVFRLVQDVLGGTKYLGDNKWLSYNALDHLLKVTHDRAYYSLPSQANQQILKLLVKDYKAFFKALEAYKSNPSLFTGRPRIPKYSKGFKTSILTNQICTVKDEKYLKLPGTKTRLNLGRIEGSLKEVRIKPSNRRFIVYAVFDVEDIGIVPADNEVLLKEFKEMTDISGLRILSIDPGTNNIAAVANNFGEKPFLIKGGVIKSINQLYNKELARLSSVAKICNGRYRTKRMNVLTDKRNRRIKDQMHKISRQIADYARDKSVDIVVMGHNVFQKQEIDIGHVSNQNFVQIPMTIFAGMLKYKLAAYGIRFVTTEESYTSQADFLAEDEIPVYRRGDKVTYIFSGERTKRGLYVHCDGTISNADINGAANIMRKVFPKVTQWDRGIVDMPCSIGYKQPEGSCRKAA